MAKGPTDAARLERIQHARHQVTTVMYAVSLCEDLAALIADPDFPFAHVPWPADITLTQEQFGRAVPYLLELQKLMKEKPPWRIMP